MPRPLAPTRQETIEELLTRSKRDAVPIRWTFVQQGGRKAPEPGPLAEFVHNHDERALDAWLLVHAAASATPFNVDLPALVWARMLGITGDDARSAVSKVWKRLEDRGLIARDRVQRLASIRLLREDGYGRAYTHPGAGAKGTHEPYFKLPYAYWRDGWDQKLRLAGKAMLLVAMSLEDGFILPEGQAKAWYGVSEDFAGDGLRALQRAGLLVPKVGYLPAPLSVTGWKEERAYTLQPPFGPRGRSRQTGKRQLAGTAAAGGPDLLGKTAKGTRIVKLRPRTGRAS